ncbi:hypothetical protein [Photobacterium leiognathi]|uniref:hypothetical protein n=1 Tax=Photobacterium leiognathi TaxID=553611 RepID=UPI002981EBD6|nr:hypothetical protein [Photobacterium leiognathi]
MADVLIFKPKHELEHTKNKADFVALWCQIAPLHDKYVYDENYGPKVGNFTIFGTNSRQRYPEELLYESLIPFAKAYVTYGGELEQVLIVNLKPYVQLMQVGRSYTKGKILKPLSSLQKSSMRLSLLQRRRWKLEWLITLGVV